MRQMIFPLLMGKHYILESNHSELIWYRTRQYKRKLLLAPSKTFIKKSGGQVFPTRRYRFTKNQGIKT